MEMVFIFIFIAPPLQKGEISRSDFLEESHFVLYCFVEGQKRSWCILPSPLRKMEVGRTLFPLLVEPDIVDSVAPRVMAFSRLLFLGKRTPYAELLSKEPRVSNNRSRRPLSHDTTTFDVTIIAPWGLGEKSSFDKSA